MSGVGRAHGGDVQSDTVCVCLGTEHSVQEVNVGC